MADITMCLNDTCELRIYCSRFNAKANEQYQSYADFKPNYDWNSVICNDMILNEI